MWQVQVHRLTLCTLYWSLAFTPTACQYHQPLLVHHCRQLRAVRHSTAGSSTSTGQPQSMYAFCFLSSDLIECSACARTLPSLSLTMFSVSSSGGFLNATYLLPLRNSKCATNVWIGPRRTASGALPAKALPRKLGVSPKPSPLIWLLPNAANSQ